MFRLILSIILTVALTGAAAASLAHGVGHGLSHENQHVEGVDAAHQMDADAVFAECCEATGSMGSGPCVFDFMASAELFLSSARRPAEAAVRGHASVVGGLTPAVPTGPPKV